MNLPVKVDDWSSENVYGWLYQGLATWHSPDASCPPFTPLAGRFNDRETPEKQIAKLCEKSPSFRSKVVESVANLLGDVPNDRIGLIVFNNLQRLISELHEPSLVLPMWMRIASTGFLDGVRSDFREELFAQAFICSEDLYASKHVVNVLTQRMLASRHFHPAWAPSALYAMLSHDPSDIAVHLAALSPFIDGIEDDELVERVLAGCKVVISETLPKSEQTAVLSGVLASELDIMASESDSLRVTGNLADYVLKAVTVEPLEVNPTPKETAQTQQLGVQLVRIAYNLVATTSCVAFSTSNVSQRAVLGEDFESNDRFLRFYAAQQRRRSLSFESELGA